MQTNILICGVGGQGIVLTSKLIAATAMAHDIPVMSAETIGMAQKGGSVCSFLRLGDGLHCPMFPEKSADIIIGFEPAEAVRMLPYLKDGGSMVLNTHPIMPVTAALSGSDYTGREMVAYLKEHVEYLITADGDAACRALKSPKVLNMVMLGIAARQNVIPFTIDDIEATMKATVKPQFIELNSRALRYQSSRAILRGHAMDEKIVALLEKYTKCQFPDDGQPDKLAIIDTQIDHFDFTPYAPLSCIEFFDIVFRSCSFRSMNLSYSWFGGSSLTHCRLETIWLLKANWDNVRMEHTTIQNMDACKTDLYDLKLQDCTIEDSSFRRCIFDNFGGASCFKDTVFRNCTFEGCSFEKCMFENVQFIGCRFSDTEIDFEHAGILLRDCKIEQKGT